MCVCVCVCVTVLTHHSSVSVCVIIAGGEGDGGESTCRINTHCNYYSRFALVHMLLLPRDQLASLNARVNVRLKKNAVFWRAERSEDCENAES